MENLADISEHQVLTNEQKDHTTHLDGYIEYLTSVLKCHNVLLSLVLSCSYKTHPVSPLLLSGVQKVLNASAVLTYPQYQATSKEIRKKILVLNVNSCVFNVFF